MHVQSLSIGRSIRHRRAIVLTIIGLLLWGMWVFAVHSHHDETLGADTECQVCQFGTHNSAILPSTGFSPIPVLTETITDSFTEVAFIAPHVRLQDARAPPFAS